MRRATDSTSSLPRGGGSNRLRCVAAALAAVLAGCASPGPATTAPGARTEPLRVWPPPPAAPRVACLGAIASPDDVGIARPWWGRAWDFLAGADPLDRAWLRPVGVAAGPGGRLAVADLAGAVHLLDPGRKLHRRWDRLGTNRLVSPVGVACGTNRLFVADSELGLVAAIDDRGRVLWEARGFFRRPTGLALDGTDLLVTDSEAAAVVRLDGDGRLVRRFGVAGAGPGQLNRPTHVAVDEGGRIFVTDAMNSRVAVYDATGGALRVIGGSGDGSGFFSRPKGVVAQAGLVFVADALFDNIQIFDAGGRFLLDVGSSGTGVGEFWLPAGLAWRGPDLLYAADSYNRRIQVFRLLPQPVTGVAPAGPALDRTFGRLLWGAQGHG